MALLCRDTARPLGFSEQCVARSDPVSPASIALTQDTLPAIDVTALTALLLRAGEKSEHRRQLFGIVTPMAGQLTAQEHTDGPATSGFDP